MAKAKVKAKEERARQYYPDGKCPDCLLYIPVTAMMGEICRNCSHVFCASELVEVFQNAFRGDLNDLVDYCCDHLSAIRRADSPAAAMAALFRLEVRVNHIRETRWKMEQGDCRASAAPSTK